MIGSQNQVDLSTGTRGQAAPGRPLVSVIMSMRNAATTVGAAVRSVQLQTLRDWELIVIDDGSSDNSAEIVSVFEDNRIRLIREATSAGLAARLNQAVALSRGDYVARMDADDICFPERLARQVESLRRDPRVDLLGCGAVVFADDVRLVGILPIKVTHAEITARPFRGFPLPHPTWCGRADWFRNNPYDARLRKTQDQDLLLRTFAHGRFAALADVLVGYRQDELGLKKTLVGRKTFIGSLWRYAQSSNWPMPVLSGILSQLLKGTADVAAIGLGLRELAQRSRLMPVPPSVEQQWRELQRFVSNNKVVD